ncbi:MAG TPA: peptidyl-prolyl cis-trans isomerase [Verrucomicrobiae bacterium]|nr:peptidyl-prolyl cis-trans isomerase [Verrucomicrobiae bacterium]
MRRELMNYFRLIPFSAVMFFLAASDLQAALVDGIKAIVSDKVITYAQVLQFTEPAEIVLRRQYADDPQTFNQKFSQALDDSLEQLVERQLILHDFNNSGYKFPESLLDELVQQRIRERFGGDRITMIKTLQAQGMTVEEFRKQVRDQFIENYMRRNKTGADKIFVSPYKIESYYLAHQDDFKVEDQVKLRMIVLKKDSPDDTNTVAIADEIRQKVKEGATFAEMASVYSQGSQQHEGGDWGWVGRSVLRKELADVAFSLKAGQMSDVIQTPDSVYLMYVEQTRPAHVRPLNDVRDDIEKTLRTQEQARLQKEWIDGLKKKTFIVYY